MPSTLEGAGKRSPNTVMLRSTRARADAIAPSRDDGKLLFRNASRRSRGSRGFEEDSGQRIFKLASRRARSGDVRGGGGWPERLSRLSGRKRKERSRPEDESNHRDHEIGAGKADDVVTLAGDQGEYRHADITNEACADQ